MSARAWILATRPKTLTAALVPIVVATALAVAQGFAIRWWISGLALLASLFIQFGTNLVNDAIDFKKGSDGVHRLGPVRVTQSGLLSARAVLTVAWIFFAAAFLCGIPLVQAGGPVILLIGLLSIAFAYLYTGGPYPLAYHGLGEIFVVIFFGGVAVGGLFFLQSQSYNLPAVVAALQVGLLASVLIEINNLRDVGEDQKNNKNTLAVLFGVRFARSLLAFSVLCPYVLGLYWWVQIKPLAFLLPLFTVPLAMKLIFAIYRTEPSRTYNSFLARAALIHLLFGILLAVGLIWPS